MFPRSLDTWNLSASQGNVFGNPRPMFDSSQTSRRRIRHSTTPSATGAVPVQGSTGTLVARGEERKREKRDKEDKRDEREERES